jgi:hypothetical protein
MDAIMMFDKLIRRYLEGGHNGRDKSGPYSFVRLLRFLLEYPMRDQRALARVSVSRDDSGQNQLQLVRRGGLLNFSTIIIGSLHFGQ